MKALVTGWFSFELMGATAGDLLASEVACAWLDRAGIPHDVAHSPSFPGGVDWQVVDPSEYTHVVFVCGPLGNGEPIPDLLTRYAHCRLVALDVSMLQPLSTWNPFDILIERESDRIVRPDITFAAPIVDPPVIGVVLVHDQKEYPGARHGIANDFIEAELGARHAAVVHIDTCFDPPNSTGLRTPREVEALIARMDVVVTTRLHGLVLALKRGIPALAIDPIDGGAKVRRQATVLGWPAIIDAGDLSKGSRWLDWCLSADAREEAGVCAARAQQLVHAIGDEFVGLLTDQPD